MSHPAEHAVAILAGDCLCVRSDLTLPRVDVGDSSYAAALCGGGVNAQAASPALLVRSAPRLILHVFAADPSDPPPPDWLSLDDLDRLAEPPEVAAGVALAARQWLDPAARPAERPAVFCPGWRAAADAWIDDQLLRLGWQRTGPSEPVKLWSLSTVWRTPIRGAVESVYLKAAFPHFAAEAAITALLSTLLPGSVPDVVAVDTDRSWLLMRPLPSVDPAGLASGIRLAGLQSMTLSNLTELRATGVAERGRAALLAGLHTVVTSSVELDLLSEPERGDVHAMEGWLATQVKALADCGLPETLVHGDLHLGNVAGCATAPMLYDWSDAAVAFPSLDVALLLFDTPADQHDGVWTTYLDVWRDALPEIDHEAVRALSPRAQPHRSRPCRTRGSIAPRSS